MRKGKISGRISRIDTKSVIPTGLEPVTFSMSMKRSSQLSYGIFSL